MNVVDPFVRQALAAPQLPALCVDDSASPITYGELLAHVGQLARLFQHAGVSPGDSVMVSAPPGLHVAATLAVAWLGAVSVAPMHGVAAPLEVNYLFHTMEADIPFDHPGAKASVKLNELSRRTPPSGTPPPIAAVDPQAPWRIAVSSGTTGVRKGIVCSHHSTVLNALLQQSVYPTGTADRVLVAMNLAIDFAVNAWLRALYAGACVVLHQPGQPAQLLKLVHSQQVTQLILVSGLALPLVLQARAADDDALRVPPPALRFTVLGGSSVSRELLDALQAHICPRVYVNYGSSETHVTAVLDASWKSPRPEYAGRLVPWMEAQAVDRQGMPLPVGQPGLLRFRSPTLASRYIGPAVVGLPNAFQDGWYQSSDIGYVTKAGLLFLLGRDADILNLGGNKFAPDRVEAAIMRDPQISDCAVVQAPGPLGEPVLAAVIVSLAEDIDIPALNARCREIAVNAAPRHLVRVRQLPRDEAGKLQRRRVRAMVERLLAERGEGATA